jgi:hypothetical protein
MKLAATEALNRLATHLHGVLGTVHPTRGVDVVPAVYAVSTSHLEGDMFIGVPIDLVKPKAHTRLQRLVNLEADPRATLLIDHWDHADWTQLWWVRAELLWTPSSEEIGFTTTVEDLRINLVNRYPQYSDSPFADILVFQVVAASGWAASTPP